jgi:hypothetical protein
VPSVPFAAGFSLDFSDEDEDFSDVDFSEDFSDWRACLRDSEG